MHAQMRRRRPLSGESAAFLAALAFAVAGLAGTAGVAGVAAGGAAPAGADAGVSGTPAGFPSPGSGIRARHLTVTDIEMRKNRTQTYNIGRKQCQGDSAIRGAST